MGVHKKESGGSVLTSALTEAQSIIEAAEQRAKDLLTRAEKEFEEARVRGYEEGVRLGKAESTQQGIRLLEAHSALSQKLAEEAAKLAIAISSSIVCEHVKVSPETVKKIAESAIQQAVISERVIIVLNPTDEETIKKHIEQLKKLAGGASIAIETDSSLQAGGCIIRTDFGEVDATIDGLIQGVAQRLDIV